MASVEEAERRRLGRELHDGLGQLLSGARMQLTTAAAKPDAAGRTEALQRIDSILGTAYETARHLMYELTPTPTLAMGLREALAGDAICSTLASRSIDYRLHCDIDEDSLPESTALHLFRIAQEAVNNAARHANASRVCVSLQQAGERISLTVEDNGCGFDAATARRGLGLDTIRDRVALLGGQHALQSGPHGTSHRCEFNLLAVNGQSTLTP